MIADDDDSKKSKQPEDRRVTAGGNLLKLYLKANDLSIGAFARAHMKSEGERVMVQRLINGVHWKQVTVDFAFKIQDATNGEVPARAFRSETAIPVPMPTIPGGRRPDPDEPFLEGLAKALVHGALGPEAPESAPKLIEGRPRKRQSKRDPDKPPT